MYFVLEELDFLIPSDNSIIKNYPPHGFDVRRFLVLFFGEVFSLES